MTRCCATLLASLTTLLWLAGSPHAIADEVGQRLFRDLQDERLDQFSLLEAALLVGGLDDADSTAVIHKWSQANRPSAGLSSLDRIHDIMQFMHTVILRGEYDEAATQLTTTVATGNYNCVSAATLFLGLAENNQLSARGVLLPGHLRCRVWVPEQQHWIDLEPTKSKGYLVSREERVTGRELDSVQVLAKLYYNRGIELLAEEDYWPALRCATYGTQLDPLHQAAQDNVAAVIRRWSVALCQQQRFEDAAYLMRQSRRNASQHRLLAEDEIHVYVHWMQHLVRIGDVRGAEDRFSEALSLHPSSEVLRNLAVPLREM